MRPEISLFLIAFLVTFPILRTYLRTKQEPEWEARWNALPQLQRQYIEDAVRRGEPLLDPEEAELAAGYARRQRATSSLFSRSPVIHFVLAGFLLLIALAGGSPVLLALVLLLLAFLIWVAYRERVTKRNLDRAEDTAAELEGHGPAAQEGRR